jgi:hypothetical protein
MSFNATGLTKPCAAPRPRVSPARGRGDRQTAFRGMTSGGYRTKNGKKKGLADLS